MKAIIIAYGAQTTGLLDAGTFTMAQFIYEIMNIYAIKMAGVFMISLSTISVRTRITPRWIAILGYALALLILFGSRYISWTVLAFPLWVLLISVYILIDNWRPPPARRQAWRKKSLQSASEPSLPVPPPGCLRTIALKFVSSCFSRFGHRQRRMG